MEGEVEIDVWGFVVVSSLFSVDAEYLVLSICSLFFSRLFLPHWSVLFFTHPLQRG